VKPRKRRLAREESGFTLTEVLVTIMIMIVVLFALYSIFDMGLRVFAFGNDKLEAVENARLGLERMEREVRAAYPYDKTAGNDERFASYGADSISFYNNLNDDRKIECPNSEGDCEVIEYTLDGSTLERNGEPVIEYVEPGGLSFEYLDGNGDPPGAEDEIEVVRMSLSVQVDEGTQELTTTVALRNHSGGP
jgi:prepilin-type N-terminal cleavage/methylation domain-containing protein